MSASEQVRASARDVAAYQQWQSLRERNPHAAAALLNREHAAIRRGSEMVNRPPTPEALAAVDELGRARGEQQAHDLLLFRRWRDLKRTNPHAAATALNENGDAIMRGRELDTESPEPPQAA